jgi:hypothetical protein
LTPSRSGEQFQQRWGKVKLKIAAPGVGDFVETLALGQGFTLSHARPPSLLEEAILQRITGLIAAEGVPMRGVQEALGYFWPLPAAMGQG